MQICGLLLQRISCTGTLLTSLQDIWKLTKNFCGNTWPARSLGLIVQNMYALQLNWSYIWKQMWSKRDLSWSMQPVGFGGLCLLNIFKIYMHIFPQITFSNSRKIFFYKVLKIRGNINSFLCRKVCFLLLTTAVSFVRCRHVGYSLSATHCSFLYKLNCC